MDRTVELVEERKVPGDHRGEASKHQTSWHQTLAPRLSIAAKAGLFPMISFAVKLGDSFREWAVPPIYKIQICSLYLYFQVPLKPRLRA